MSGSMLFQGPSATAVCLLVLLAPSNVSAQRTSSLPDPGEWGYRPVYVEDAMVPAYRAPSNTGAFATPASALAIDILQEGRVDRPAFAGNPPYPPGRVMGVGLAGLMGAAVGLAGGAYLGHEAERKWYRCECDDPGLAGLLLGALVGPVIVTPLATHLANERRGSLGLSYAVTAAIAGVGFLGLTSGTFLDSSDTIVFLATPIAEAIGSMVIEVATGR